MRKVLIKVLNRLCPISLLTVGDALVPILSVCESDPDHGWVLLLGDFVDRKKFCAFGVLIYIYRMVS